MSKAWSAINIKSGTTICHDLMHPSGNGAFQIRKEDTSRFILAEKKHFLFQKYLGKTVKAINLWE